MARSPSPHRSRSPPRTKKPKSSGFKWKESSRRDDGERADKSEDKGLERGYRHERDGYRERDDQRRERSRSRERQHRRRDEDEDERRARKERRRERERKEGASASETATQGKATDQTHGSAPAPAQTLEPTEAPRATTIDDDIDAKFGAGASVGLKSSSTAATATTGTDQPPMRPPPTGSSGAARPVATGPMIVVKINDRLGTTSKVPCLASDTVGDFKKMVAMRIGRKPHEIMLKRQSERPFKDFLTLADYNVSDGVQLDLELDTGD